MDIPVRRSRPGDARQRRRHDFRPSPLARLEDRLLLSRARAQAPVPMPGNTVASAGDVMYMNADVPTKQITITNNTDRTIYPFLEDANTGLDPVLSTKDKPVSLYDPLDAYNQEFRGYIGYTAADGQNELGLLAGQQITIDVPLVFWNAGRIEFATTGQDLVPNATNLAPNNPPDPFRYYAFNTGATVGSQGTPTARFATPAAASTDSNGVVMWYHAAGLAQGPANDAPSQLTELTIRDPYLQTLPTANEIPASEKNTTLINYDVSYVDSILMPIAMEAGDVTLFPGEPNSPRRPYGWIGANLTYRQMQNALQAFASDDPAMNHLGQYFGGKGYDKYYNPDPDDAGTKLPAGQNLIGDSPFSGANGVRSSYDNNLYALSSGGAGPIEIVNGAFPDGTTTLKLVPAAGHLLDGLKVGMTVTSPTPGIVPAGTTIAAINQTGADVTSVTLSAPATGENGDSYVFVFARPVMDHVARKLTDLWYGWADYYVRRNAKVPAVTGVAGTTTDGGNVLTLAAPVSGLVPGMAISSSAGLLPMGTTILGIGTGGTTIELSKLATAAGGGTYSFTPPAEIPRSVEVHPLGLTFSDAARPKADRFAQTVYAVMSAMSSIPPNPDQGSTSIQLMFNALGGNIGLIPNITPSSVTVVPVVSNTLRDDVKSVLRGVYDFHNVLESQWYPDPSQATAGATVDGNPADFNVYNLNPFVWFVHQQLGLSGYGFSLDDDVADVGAPGANQLLISVGGLGGLPISAEWTPGAPFGPVDSTTGQITNGSTVLNGLDRNIVAQLSPADPNSGVLGALVTGPGIAPGTRVVSIVIGGTSLTLSQPATSDGQASATTPYHFAGSLSASGPHGLGAVKKHPRA